MLTLFELDHKSASFSVHFNSSVTKMLVHLLIHCIELSYTHALHVLCIHYHSAFAAIYFIFMQGHNQQIYAPKALI